MSPTGTGFLAPATAVALAVLAASAPPAEAGRHGRHHSSTSVSISDDGNARTCGDLRVRFDGRPSARAEETISLSVAEARGLKLRASENGGVHVRGGDRRDVAVTVCKVASGADDADAARLLAGISLKRDGTTLTVEGPSDERWVGFLLIEAPNGAELDVAAENGPLSVRDFSGTLTAAAENGPIELRRVSGSVTARASNGPIELTGGSGRLDLETTNGPLSVDLSGSRWDGEGLRARTTNGPVDLTLPEGFTSAVRVEGSRWSPVDCDARPCDGARREKSEDGRLITFGSGEPVVRLSTTNGPVTIH